MEAASGQGHGAQAGARGGSRNPAGETGGDRVVKDDRAASRVVFVGKAGDERRRIEIAVGPHANQIVELGRERIRLATGGNFEKHRRLAFGGARLAHAEQRRSGGEPAAHAARRRRAQVAHQHRGHRGRCGTAGKATSDLGAAPIRCKAAAAMRHGSRAAASPPGIGSVEVTEAAKRRAVDGEELAAPRGTVVAEADAVEREAEQRTVDTVPAATAATWAW